MEKTRKKKAAISFTYKDAQLLSDIFDVIKAVRRNDAHSYFREYLKLWPQYRRLRASGLNVRFSPVHLGSRPLLVIDQRLEERDRALRKRFSSLYH
jgi:hypothetical protein